MTKNETVLIIRRAQVTNNYVGVPPGAKRHRADFAYWQQRWRRSFPSVRGRKPSLRLFPAPSPTQPAPSSRV